MIYLDNSATTRVTEAAAKKAVDIMTKCFGNPSSLHSLGFSAELEFKNARKILCSALCCKEGELFFTSGGTEANNTAIIGTARANCRRGNKIVISAIEHSSVLEAAEYLSQNGFEVVKIYPDKNGEITPNKIAEAVDEKTILVSLMLVNNEIGTLYDIATISAAARRKNNKVIVHTDASQAFCKIPVNVGKLGADLVTITAHKIGAPKGCGALYIKKGTKIQPIIFGGEQQNRFRPGTENISSIAAFSVACENAQRDMAQNFKKARELKERLVENLLKIENVSVNCFESSIPYIVNFSTNAVKSETLIHFLEKKDIFVSGGSACAKGKRSHVLSSLSLDDKAIDTAIRVSFGYDNTESDIDIFVNEVRQAVDSLQKIK